jgi:hypothetical protein
MSLGDYKAVAPIMTNRFIIESGLAPEKFDSFKLKFTDGELKLYLNIRNFDFDVTNATEIQGIRKVKIKFLNPVGDEVEYLDMMVNLESFELEGKYVDLADILNYKCVFNVIDINTKKMEEEANKTLENYLKRKEEENKK